MRRSILLLTGLLLTLSFVAGVLPPAHSPSPVMAQDGGNNEEVAVARPYLIVNTYALNLRTGPSKRYAVLGVLRGGDSYNIEGKSPDGIWFYVVDTPYGDGWVRGKYTIFRGEINEINIIAGPYGTLVQNRLYLHVYSPAYDFPGGDRLGLVPGREEYPVTGRSFNGNWIRFVTPEFGEVWTNTSRVSFRGYWLDVPIIREPYEGSGATLPEPCKCD
jgi:hypothetical protein